MKVQLPHLQSRSVGNALLLLRSLQCMSMTRTTSKATGASNDFLRKPTLVRIEVAGGTFTLACAVERLRSRQRFPDTLLRTRFLVDPNRRIDPRCILPMTGDVCWKHLSWRSILSKASCLQITHRCRARCRQSPPSLPSKSSNSRRVPFNGTRGFSQPCQRSPFSTCMQ